MIEVVLSTTSKTRADLSAALSKNTRSRGGRESCESVREAAPLILKDAMTTIISPLPRANLTLAAMLAASLGTIGMAFRVPSPTPRARETNIHPMITSSPSEIKQWNAAVEQKKRDRHMRRLNRAV